MTTTNPEHYAQRSFSVRIDDADESQRTVYGTVMPYDTPTTVDDGMGPYREAFAPGAFDRSINQSNRKVPLKAMHARQQFPLGQVIRWDDSPSALRGHFRVSDTAPGNDALTLITDGVVDAFSVGFRSIQSETRDDTVYRTEVKLLEVSLVDSPAYAGAAIEGVRSLTGPSEVDEWLEHLPDATRDLLVARLVPADTRTDLDPADTRTVATMTAPAALLRVRDFPKEDTQ
jgi:HK97 family phage prohead protease